MSAAATPMMNQWHSAKSEHPDGILFFRMGDFFEFFHEDAKKAARLLALTLTSRSKGDASVPMAGVPVRSVDQYVRRLVRAGEKVVICDQVEDPSAAEGLVDRRIVRIVTPGTLTEDEALEAGRDNFLAALSIDKRGAAIAWVDVSTGRFATRRVEANAAIEELARLDPVECLIDEDRLGEGAFADEIRRRLSCTVTPRPRHAFDRANAARRLGGHFGTTSLEGFGIDSADFPLGAAGAILDYLEETQRGAAGQVRRLMLAAASGRMILDRSTRFALELVRTQRDGERDGSLLSVLDRTSTPMGARLLRAWVLEPLTDRDAIVARHLAVDALFEDRSRLESLRGSLRNVLDIARLAGRVGCQRAHPRDLVGLRNSLDRLPELASALEHSGSSELEAARSRIPDLSNLCDLLGRALVDEPPLALKEGGIIRAGFNEELDELRSIGKEGKDFIAAFQAREAEATGIPLKVGYNRVFGYYIEITNVYRDRLPPRFVRKQTLKNAERYITDELKTYEDKVLHAEERKNELEYELFIAVREQVMARLDDLQEAAAAVAIIDAFQSLAHAAHTDDWVRPEMTDSGGFRIVEGRHPVLARPGSGDPFVPNDVDLDDERRVMVITGPNMAGKSTYIRQTALIALMAQIGSFVPARSAVLPVFDRVFTRVGAHDDISRGASTFMVEMLEVANILNHANSSSLVILDEVGRGTSTYDGLAIAWAVTEHLALRVKSKTLFATHYHELTDLSERLPAVSNHNVAVREWGDDIVFLHKITSGAADKSYGVHVARLAGVPRPVLEMAREVLSRLETGAVTQTVVEQPSSDEVQMGLFGEPAERIRDRLLQIDLDELTPRRAHEVLEELQRIATGTG